MYRSNDVIVTKDGMRHRVIYAVATGVFVRTIGRKSTKPHMIPNDRIVAHEPQGTPA